MGLFVSLGLVVTSLAGVKLITLNTHADSRGKLTAIEGESELPFPIHRLFYVYDVTPGGERAGHAHPDTDQCLIAISGSLDVDVMNPNDTKQFHLNDPGVGLYVPAMLWVRLHNFTSGAVCLAAASTHYEPASVVRSWDDYVRIAGASEAAIQ